MILFLLIAIPIALTGSSAESLWDWMTGKATQNEDLAITISLLTVDWVSQVITPQSVVEGFVDNVTFYFTASIPGGAVADINDTSARANFTSGSTTRENLTCALVGDIDADTANYTCTVRIWYWDPTGTYTVIAAIADNSGNWASNGTITFTLSDSTCFGISPNQLNWSTAIPGAKNLTSNNDPSLLNNTCNHNVITGYTTVRAKDLLGVSNGAYFINSSNFSVSTFTGGNAECNSTGAVMINNTYVNVTTAILSAGNNSLNFKNTTSGQEELYYCIREVTANLISQSYSTSKLGSWTLQVS